jgi:cyclophilin family peptidyl-prolyl cis-trans isomerase/protein-tyrosine-phosphatase
MKHLMTTAFVITGLMAAGSVFAAQEHAPASQPAASQHRAGGPAVPGHPRVALEIEQGGEKMGTIVIELDEKHAPITVKNFLRYVDEGFYDGTIFHRVISDFMIQAGGFTGTVVKKEDGLHAPIRNEWQNGLSNVEGSAAMARLGGQHDSATSQFFINVVDNSRKLDKGYDGAGYAVYGRVVRGMDVVDKVRMVKTKPSPLNPREVSWPEDPPVIRKARRVEPFRRVLFICSGASTRAPMAVGLLREMDGIYTEAVPSGTRATGRIHPMTVQVMKEIGIDVSALKPRPVDQLKDERFDVVVTLCDEADRECPTFSHGAPRRLHWPIDSPAGAEGSDEDRLEAFRKTRDELKAKIEAELVPIQSGRAASTRPE